MNDELKQGLDLLGLPAEQEKLSALRVYLTELGLFNPKLKLVGDEPELWIRRHILDSLAAVPLLKRYSPRTAADLGSGAGLPGLLLALFMPETKFILVEKMGSRCGFLRNAAAMMGLKNAEVFEGQWENVQLQTDLIVMRAFLPLSKILGPLRRLEPGTLVAAYKGKRSSIDEELLDLAGRMGEPEILSMDVPFLKEERHLVVFVSGKKE